MEIYQRLPPEPQEARQQRQPQRPQQPQGGSSSAQVLGFRLNLNHKYLDGTRAPVLRGRQSSFLTYAAHSQILVAMSDTPAAFVLLLSKHAAFLANVPHKDPVDAGVPAWVHQHVSSELKLHMDLLRGECRFFLFFPNTYNAHGKVLTNGQVLLAKEIAAIKLPCTTAENTAVIFYEHHMGRASSIVVRGGTQQDPYVKVNDEIMLLPNAVDGDRDQPLAKPVPLTHFPFA